MLKRPEQTRKPEKAEGYKQYSVITKTSFLQNLSLGDTVQEGRDDAC